MEGCITAISKNSSNMLPETCKNCYHADEAIGPSRPILICNHKNGSEGKFFVIKPKGRCHNFQPKKPVQPSPPSPQDDGARFIPLTQGKFAIVDADDYDRLAKYEWYCQKDGNTFYAYRSKPARLAMHREITKAPKGMLVDHIDGNGLNNRKSNVRVCTRAQNAWNRRPLANCRSRYKGVTEHKTGKWQAHITASRKTYHLGSFDDEAEAALAYDRKAKELFGEFAYLNFPGNTD